MSEITVFLVGSERDAAEVERLVTVLDGHLRAVRRITLPQDVLEKAWPNDARVTQSSRQPTASGLALVDGYHRDGLNLFLVREMRALGARVGGTPTSTPMVHPRQRCILIPDAANDAAIVQAVEALNAPVETLRQEGIALYKADKCEEARILLEKAAALAPDSFDVQLYLGRSNYYLKRYEPAGVAFDIACRLQPEDARPWAELGKVKAAGEQWEQAISLARRSLTLDAKNRWTRLALGDYLSRSGKTLESLEVLEPLSRDEPDFKWVWQSLAEVYLTAKRNDDARRACENELRLDPNSKLAKRRLATLNAPAPGAAQAVPGRKASAAAVPAAVELPWIDVPVCVHLVRHATYGTARTSPDGALEAINAAWKEARIRLKAVAVQAPSIPGEALEKAFPGQAGAGHESACGGLVDRPEFDRNGLNIYLVKTVPIMGSDGKTTRFYSYPRSLCLLFPDGLEKHPLGVSGGSLLDLIGIKRLPNVPDDRMCRISGTGTVLVQEEIARARAWAAELAARPRPVADPLEALLAELQAMVGPAAVKEKLTSLANYARIEMVRRQKGLPQNRLDLHAVFVGPPGTGRKRMARLLARLYHHIGAVASDTVVELQAPAFLAGPGEARTRAAQGVLLIDELVRDVRTTVTVSNRDTGSSRSVSEDESAGLAVQIRHSIKEHPDVALLLVATPAEMNALLAADPALGSVLRNRVEGDHLERADLARVFDDLVAQRRFTLEAGARQAVEQTLRHAWEQRDAAFSNARVVSRLFNDVLERQANRVVKLANPSDTDLTTIVADDVPQLHVDKKPRRVKEGWLVADLNVIEAPLNDTLEAALAELDSMIGLESVKQRVHSLVRLISVQQRRVAQGLSTTPVSLHVAFVGPPGTGKTTVARLMGRIFKALGLLSRGHTVETDRTAFIAAYLGQTALKSNETIDQAVHGVLFIDEAYTLVSNTASNDYGSEAIGVLLKRMEDDRSKLSVIAAGYVNEMEKFFDGNPGLRSRFTQTIRFEDYSIADLSAIFDQLCERGRYVMTPEARQRLRQQMEWVHAQRDQQFGNARWVRTLFEKVVDRQASRVADDANADLQSVVEADIPTPELTPVRAGESLLVSEPPLQDSLEQVLSELDSLTGLGEVKQKIRSLLNVIRAEMQRQKQGLQKNPLTLHLIFSGPPGTGKTTVARLIGRAYRALGLLQRGHLVETDRTGLVGQYAGSTAPRVNAVVDRAKHGVLFVDEAYALSASHDALGQEAINILVKRLEDDREHLAVVLAGYEKEMKEFLSANPGLRSRFQGTIHFERYSALELVAIFEGFCKGQLTLTEAARARLLLRFEEAALQRNDALGNGRLARQIFQEALERQANRIADSGDAEALRTLEAADIPEDLPGQRKPKMVNAAERETTAYHELGHAIVGHLLPAGRKVKRISIIAYSETNLGYTLYHTPEKRYTDSPEQIRSEIASALGGLSAEEVQYGYPSTGTYEDMKTVTDLASKYVQVHGMSPLGPLALREVSPELKRRIDEEIQATIEAAHQAVLTILRANHDLMREMAARLLAIDVIEGDELEQGLGRAVLPASVEPWQKTGQLLKT